MDLQAWLNLANDHLLTGMLVLARMGAMIFAAPMFTNRGIPAQVRLGLAGAITLILTPLMGPTHLTGLPYIAGLVKEIVFGLVLGWVASTMFSAAQIAGEWLDLNGGFQSGRILNPAFNDQNAPIGNFLHLVAGLVFLAVGGHILVLRAGAASFALSRPGSLALRAGSMQDWAGLLTSVLWVALQIAAPISAAIFLLEIAMAFSNKALPQMNTMLLSMPAKGLLAIALVALTIPVIVHVLELTYGQIGSQLVQVIQLMAG